MRPRKDRLFPAQKDLYGNPTILKKYNEISAAVVHYGYSLDGKVMEAGIAMLKENINQVIDPCADKVTGVLSSYAKELLETQMITDIFMVLVATDWNGKLIGKNVISLGFAICTQQKKDIYVELSLVCSNKTGLSLNISGMLLVELISFYATHSNGTNLRLYAIDYSLIYLYYSFGFILVPLLHKCDDLTPEYVEKWRNTMNPFSTATWKKLQENELEQKVFNNLVENTKKEDYYYKIPGKLNETTHRWIKEAKYGYYMILCQQYTPLKQIRLKVEQKFKNNITAWNEMFETYTFELKEEQASAKKSKQTKTVVEKKSTKKSTRKK